MHSRVVINIIGHQRLFPHAVRIKNKMEHCCEQSSPSAPLPQATGLCAFLGLPGTPLPMCAQHHISEMVRLS